VIEAYLGRSLLEGYCKILYVKRKRGVILLGRFLEQPNPDRKEEQALSLNNGVLGMNWRSQPKPKSLRRREP
jgi:hypothetical protein